MAWTDIPGNKMLTFNDLQEAVNTGGYTLKNTILSSNRLAKNSDAYYYLNVVNQSPSNKMISKNNLIADAPVLVDNHIYVQIYLGNPAGGNVEIFMNSQLSVYSNLEFRCVIYGDISGHMQNISCIMAASLNNAYYMTDLHGFEYRDNLSVQYEELVPVMDSMYKYILYIV